jgi:DNA mismatch repair ATPase MutS
MYIYTYIYIYTHTHTLYIHIRHEQVGNYHMGYVEEGDSRIAFMYRLVKGSAKRSFGLNVALLAKLPQVLSLLARLVQKYIN